MAKTYLFVKDKKDDEVISVLEYDETRFTSQKALLDSLIAEKRNLERLFPTSKFVIEQCSGEDISSIAKMFPEIVGRSKVDYLHNRIIVPDIARYVQASYTYYVEKNGEDKVIDKHTIEGGTIPVFLIEKVIGITGDAPGVGAVSDLELKVSTPQPNESRWTLLGHSASKFYLGINLWPPVEKGQAREFILEYKWRGIWDPLRNNGQDSGFAEIGVATDLLEIGIVFPPGVEAEMIRESDIGDLRFGSEGERKKITWCVQNAPPGRYSYVVKKTN